MTKAILYGIGASLAYAPILALAAWLSTTQGHWNPPYIIGSAVVLDILIGMTAGILQRRGWRL